MNSLEINKNYLYLINIPNHTLVPVISSSIEVGDWCFLTCGGSLMVVAGISSDKTGVVCAWHDQEGKPQQETYHKKLLMKLDFA